MDIGSSVSEEELILGENEVLKKVRNGELRKVVYSNKISSTTREKLKEYSEFTEIEFEEFDGSPKELGAECKRPHIVSVVGIKK